jgi:hypothetical protein
LIGPYINKKWLFWLIFIFDKYFPLFPQVYSLLKIFLIVFFLCNVQIEYHIDKINHFLADFFLKHLILCKLNIHKANFFKLQPSFGSRSKVALKPLFLNYIFTKLWTWISIFYFIFQCYERSFNAANSFENYLNKCFGTSLIEIVSFHFLKVLRSQDIRHHVKLPLPALKFLSFIHSRNIVRNSLLCNF